MVQASTAASRPIIVYNSITAVTDTWPALVVQNLHGCTVCLLLHSIQAYCDAIGHNHKAVIKYQIDRVFGILLPLNMQTHAQHVRALTKICILHMRLWQASVELLHSLQKIPAGLILTVTEQACQGFKNHLTHATQ